jgi:hypothetical protein
MRNYGADTWSAIIFITIWVIAVIGWGLNIYKLWGIESLDVKAILRIVGIFVGPLGSILGFIP